MSNIEIVACVGVALAGVAAGMLSAAVFFGDWLLKTDRALRLWMDVILWCMTGGLFATAVTAACTAAYLPH